VPSFGSFGLASSLSKSLQQIRINFLVSSFVRRIAEINEVGNTYGARVCFFDLFPEHYQFSRPLIAELSRTQHVILLVCDKNHSAYLEKRALKNIHVFKIDKRWLPFIFQCVQIPYLATPASHLHPSAVRSDVRTIHTYHSLVSMHAVYGDDAFDGFTDFFACGPHHVREILAIRAARGLPSATIHEVGYPKLDNLAEIRAAKQKFDISAKKIVLAASWHANNIVALHYEAICEVVLALGYVLIIRPHPHLYDRDYSTMHKLRAISTRYLGRIIIENPRDEFESFWNADLMISDWSGVALEYAFATERPVIFIDAPRKVNSIVLLGIPLLTIEDVARTRIGVKVDCVERLAEGIHAALALSPGTWTKRISEGRDEYLFNYRKSAITGAAMLSELTSNAEMLAPATISKKRIEELIRFYL